MMKINKWNQPWYTCWYNAFRRCNDPKNNRYQYYGAKGIKFELSFWEMGYLWLRDKASQMKKPQIHRDKEDQNYCVNNCSFIESSIHSKITHTGKKRSVEARFRMSKSGGTLYSENHGMAKLTNNDVKNIKIDLELKIYTVREIANRYLISKSTVYAIKSGVIRKKG